MKINFQRSIKGVFYDRPFNLVQKYKKPNSFLGKMVIILNYTDFKSEEVQQNKF